MEIDFQSLDTISRVAVYGSSSETVYYDERELERILAIDDDATWTGGIIDIIECLQVSILLVPLC